MSFSRLRRSKRYDDVIAIYEQVQNKSFFGREVGMTHSKISVLKNDGDIVMLQDKQRITTDRMITYKVARYRLSDNAVSKVEEDIENGRIKINIRPTIFDELKEKSHIISTEIIPPAEKSRNT